MGKRLALAIGIGEYGEGFEALPGSLLDVRAMKSLLEDPDRGAFEVTTLENCDRTKMETAIEQFFRDKAPEDVLLLYFSGHGDLGSGGISDPQLHFCAHNSYKQNKQLFESSAMSGNFLKRRMEVSKSKQIIVILDCCYSSAIGDLLKKGGDGIPYSKLTAKGRAILASSSASKVSLQEKDGLSLYTRYLIEGIKEGVPYNGDWTVVQDLHAYAERRFEIESKGGYLPKIIAEDTSYNLPIAKAPKFDPKLEYRQSVDLIFQQLDSELGLAFNGTIEDDLDRGSLETYRIRLEISPEEAQEIEGQVQKPYLVRAEKRSIYADYFKKAVKDGNLPTERARHRLEEIRQNLLLGQEDAERIERELSQQLNLKPRNTLLAEAAKSKPRPWVQKAEGVEIEMVSLPGGIFQMGSADDNTSKPQHWVNVPAFSIGKYPVTQAQWQAIMGNNPSEFKGNEQNPVEQVTWSSAQDFCQKLSQKTGQQFRLPSEAEWEYACRTGTTTAYSFGNDASQLSEYAWYSDNSGSKTWTVGRKKANAWGIYDMHGNVWEWCADNWHDN